MKKLYFKNIFIIFILLFVLVGISFALRIKNETKPLGLEIFEKAYPDIKFDAYYDSEKDDWKVYVFFPGEKTPCLFYWSDGRFIPLDKLEQKEEYWTLLYLYADSVKDPDEMSEDEKESLLKFSSQANRRNGKGTPMFFFESLYQSTTREELEKNLVAETFLGKKTTVHRRIVRPLKKVEERIIEKAKTDEETKVFVEDLKSADAYSWREIDGTNRRSFHSLGIAVDVLPRRITGEIYWSWARDKNPSGWMLTPLSKRWMPPKEVIRIFEEEGFIWGGKWGIWDNMHFEYHPELILFSRQKH